MLSLVVWSWGTGIGFGLKSRISSGGTDIVSLTIRKKTGRDVGNISLIVNGIIMVLRAFFLVGNMLFIQW